MSTALTQPRITRVLPALAGVEPASATESIDRQAPRPRLSIGLGGVDRLEIWDDCVVAPDAVYQFDDYFDARLVNDPRAPLTVDPPIGIGLLARGAYWANYMPPREEDALHAIYAIREACGLRGLTLSVDDPLAAPNWSPADAPRAASAPMHQSDPMDWTDLTAGVSSNLDSQDNLDIVRATPEETMPASTRSAWSPSEAGETVLAALSHLSVLFLPVLAPALVWLTLRERAPYAARQAREATIFQCCWAAVGLAVLADAVHAASVSGLTAGTLGLIAFALLQIVVAAWAFIAAAQALRGASFRYLDFAWLQGLTGRIGRAR